MIALVASGSLAVALPGAAAFQLSALATLEGELGAALALLVDLQTELPGLELEAQAAASLSAELAASLNVDPSATIAASLAFAGDAQLALASNLTGPAFSAELAAQVSASAKAAADLSAKVSLKAKAIADVTARIAGLRAAISLAASLGEDLASAGVRVYLYEGPLANLGAEISALLDTPAGRDGLAATTPVFVPILVTDRPTTSGAMARVFKVSP